MSSSFVIGYFCISAGQRVESTNSSSNNRTCMSSHSFRCSPFSFLPSAHSLWICLANTLRCFSC
jgi:hypothetical protein